MKYFHFSLAIIVFVIVSIPVCSQPFFGVNNDPAVSSGNRNIYTSASVTSQIIDQFVINSKLIAYQEASGGNVPQAGNIWYRVYLPSKDNINVSGYVPAGSPYIIPVCNISYLSIQNPNAGTPFINIRTQANTTSSVVQIDGDTARVYNGLKFALVSTTPTSYTSAGGTVYNMYQIYLSKDCSRSTGWIVGRVVTTNQTWATISSSSTNVLQKPSVAVPSTTNTTASLSITSPINYYFRTYDANYGSGVQTITSNGTTTPVTGTLNGLTTGTNYSVFVIAKNNAGCTSSQSTTQPFLTTGITTYSITGRVTLSSGTGLQNVVVSTALGLQGITSGTGDYTIPNVPTNYSGTVSATYLGYSFTPLSLNVTYTNNTNKNFIATQNPNTYSITGRVTLSNGTGLQNVVVSTALGLQGITSGTGDYTIPNVPTNYSGTVSATYSGYSFNPLSLNVTSTNNTNKNFVASSATLYIDIANLRLYADNIPASGNPRTISGNVHIVPINGCSNSSKVLHFAGNLLVNTSTNTISGNGLIYCLGVGSFSQVNLYNGPYSLIAVNDALASSSNLLNALLKLGGCNLSIQNMQIQCTGIKINGKLKMPDVLSYASSSGSIEAAITSLYLTTSGIDLAGGIRLSDLKVKRNFYLEYFNIDFNSNTDDYDGKTRFSTNHFKIDAQVAVRNKQLDKVSLGAASVTHGVVPLGTTGLAIDSVGGGLENMSSSATLPLNLIIGARIVPMAYPGVALSALGSCVIEANYKWNTSFGARGKFSLFGSQSLFANFAINPNVFEIEGNVNILNTIKGNAKLSVTRSSGNTKLRGNFDANLTIPTINRPYGLSVIMAPFAGKTFGSTNNYLTNDYLAGTLKIDYTPRIFYVLKRTPNWGFDFSTNHQILPLEAQNQLPFGRTFRTNGQRLTYAFTLLSNTEAITLSAKGTSASPKLSVYLTNGDSLTVANHLNHSNVKYLVDYARFITSYIITNPPQGIYYVWSPDADSIDVIRINQAPKIAIKSVSNNLSTKELSVEFSASDPDDDAHISFGFDNDKTNINGTVMIDDISENGTNGNVLINYSNLKSGIYYLYASITDSLGQNNYVYFDTPIKTIANSPLNTPSNLIVSGTPNNLLFNFNKNNNTPLNYILYFSNASNGVNLSSKNFSIGDTNMIEINDLPPGRFYEFAVSALDTLGNESDLSNVASITWQSNTINNFPTFNLSNIIRRITVGNTLSFSIPATDPDGDALAYSILSGPLNAQINSMGLLTWLTNSSNLGYSQFIIKVSDNRGGFDSVSFDVFVHDAVMSKPQLSLNKSGFDNYLEKGIIEVTDPVITREDNISNLNVRVYSTSDPVGITVSTSKISSTVPTFSFLLNFTAGPSSLGKIQVKRADTIWIKYTSIVSGLTVTNYALFNYLKADFIFKDSICNSDTIKFYNASKGSNLKYVWNFGDNLSTNETSPSHTFPVKIGSGYDRYNVMLIITNSQGSQDTLNKIITVFKKSGGKIIPLGPISFCKGGAVTLSAEPAETYKWSTGAITPSITVSAPGNYILTTSNGNKCFSTDNVTIRVNSFPSIDAGRNSNITQGKSVQIGGSPTAQGTGPFKYKWTPSRGIANDSISNPFVTPVITTTYKVVVSDANGCSGMDSLLVKVQGITVYPNPTNGSNILTIAGSELENAFYTFKIVDAAGRIYLSELVKINNNIIYKQIPISYLSDGIYFLSIETYKDRMNYKFVKSH